MTLMMKEQEQKEQYYYQGEYKKGSRDGYGYELSTDHAYRGYFRNNCRYGNGEYIDRQQNKYVGKYKTNFKHGYGYYEDPNDNKYMGEFNRDLK